MQTPQFPERLEPESVHVCSVVLAQRLCGSAAPAKPGLPLIVSICSDAGKEDGSGACKPTPSRCSSVRFLKDEMVVGREVLSGMDVRELEEKETVSEGGRWILPS